MAKVLVYKTAQGTISVLVPIKNAQLQQELSRQGKDAWGKTHEASLIFEQSRNHVEGIIATQKRLDWHSNVKDFDNLTDKEFEAFHECNMPIDAQYSYWIDDSQLPADKSFRDAWNDIDANGNVTHDLEKAKQIQIARDVAEQEIAAKQAAKDNHPLNAQVITSVDQLKGARNVS